MTEQEGDRRASVRHIGTDEEQGLLSAALCVIFPDQFGEQSLRAGLADSDQMNNNNPYVKDLITTDHYSSLYKAAKQFRTSA